MSHYTPDEIAACRHLVALALAEDFGSVGDCTSAALIPPDRVGRAHFVARTPGCLAGVVAAEIVTEAVSSALRYEAHARDGQLVAQGKSIAVLAGPMRAILAAERTALNFMQRLSGVATLTRRYVDAVAGTRAAILDTRKTTPGWRLLEKHAVRAGGGTNHRLGLYDGVLIKDNHLAGLGDPSVVVGRAVELARQCPGNAGLSVEIEVDTLHQLALALAARPDIILLDNMTTDQLRTAVEARDRSATGVLLEASGGVTLDTVRAIAETGVDRISVGALTHSAPALDIALDYLPS